MATLIEHLASATKWVNTNKAYGLRALVRIPYQLLSLSHIHTLFLFHSRTDCNLIQFSNSAPREKAFKKKINKNKNNIETFSKQ